MFGIILNFILKKKKKTLYIIHIFSPTFQNLYLFWIFLFNNFNLIIFYTSNSIILF